jgi:hypothetical protein
MAGLLISASGCGGSNDIFGRARTSHVQEVGGARAAAQFCALVVSFHIRPRM